MAQMPLTIINLTGYYADMTFAFYDFETTGVSAEFDQPVQWAAILTDDNFKPLKKINIRCKLAPHILPSPSALAITGIMPQLLLDPSLPNWFEFTQSIRKLILDWSPTTWIGYNSLNFDEEFLRQSLYQNLQPNLYETQSHGNDRLDTMLAVHAVWVKNPNILNWPIDSNGRPIFKLDQLAACNDFKSHNAHDALGDVEATIHITKVIKSGDPNLWQAILENRDKGSILNRLKNFQPLDLIVRFGGAPPRAITGCLCGLSESYRNSVGFFDLGLANPGDYVDADDETLFKAISASPKIIRAVSINKVPNLFEGSSMEGRFRDRAQLIAKRPDFQKRVGIALANRYPETDMTNEPVEKRIYDGFYTRHDLDALKKFQNANWEERVEIVSSFKDKRLKQLGKRIIAFENSKLCSEADSEKFQGYLREKWFSSQDAKPEWTTIHNVKEELAEIREKKLISIEKFEELKDFYAERLKVIGDE